MEDFAVKKTFLPSSIAAVLVALQCIGWPAGSAASEADGYPGKSVRIVVPYLAGAASDMLARTLATQLEGKWKQSVYVENLGGAGGMLGASNVARAPADGYSLVVIASGHAILPVVMTRPPFDLSTAFAPITMLAKSPLVIVANKQSGINTFADMVARAKEGPLSFGSPGIGSKHHVIMVELARAAGLKLQHVPYRGAAQAMNDLLGGHLPLQMASTSFAHNLINSGQINGLAIVADKRHPMLPNVPTLTELGYPFSSPEWFALLAPAGTPPAITKKIASDVAVALKSPEFKTRMPADEVVSSTPEELGRFLRDEATTWGGAAKNAGIIVD